VALDLPLTLWKSPRGVTHFGDATQARLGEGIGCPFRAVEPDL
jgi:hypothetical protein